MSAVKLPHDILLPSDPGYDNARQVWNGMIDRRPALIARCHSASDVAAAVHSARDSSLEIAVKGGGHSLPGLSVCEGGMMIDLSPMKNLAVDAETRIAKAGPGLLWGEFDAGTQAQGLATPGGEISHTGVAGLTLGGGIGWLSRRHGLACDNLVGVELVLADASILQVDDASDPELMWGLRGGGGNFGIVTEFRFRVHQIPRLYAGILGWPADRGRDLLHHYCDFAHSANRDLSLVAAQIVAPPAPFVPTRLQGQPIVVVAAVWTGPEGQGENALAKLRAEMPAFDTSGKYSYTDIQRWFDAGVPHGRRYHIRSEWLSELDTAACKALVASAAEMSSPFNQILLRRLGGAISDIPADATAFRFRDARYMLTIAAGWDAGDDEPHVSWSRRAWERTRPWSAGGGYVNHLAGDEGQDRVRQAYGPATWERLLALKRRCDPDNVYHLNQNVDPQ